MTTASKSASANGTKTTSTTTTIVERRKCHTLTEVTKGLLLAEEYRDVDMIKAGATVLVPLLSSLPKHMWNLGFKGRIHAIPIPNGGILPIDVLERSVDEIINLIEAGEKVGMYCYGGHGRTGYMAAAVLGKMYPGLDPIAFLRKFYCKNAVETKEQIQQLRSFLNLPLPHLPSYAYRFEPIVLTSTLTTKPRASSGERCSVCGRKLKKGRCVNGRCGAYGGSKRRRKGRR